ncbi:LysR family transcriptional regulator [Thioclava sp. BHET1]|nr:LysR family transcriptional regulator [Thioclava sp. BHET1]
MQMSIWPIFISKVVTMSLPLASQLQIRHLRLIVAIAEQRQLSLAAEALAMTQPAASRMLATLEQLIGAPLFIRHPKGMELTDVGEELARHARNILDEIGLAATGIDKLRRGSAGLVRIGAVTGAAVGYVVPAMQRLKTLAPDVELHIDVGPSEMLIQGLVALRYDMMLGRLPPGADTAEFTLQRASSEKICFVVNRAHRLARQRAVTLAQIAGDDWVMQGPGAPMRLALEEAFLRAGAPLPRNVTNTASLLITLSLLREANVVTPVSQEVADLLTDGQPDLTQLDMADTQTIAPYSLVTLTGRRLSPVALRCHGLLSEMLHAG